MPNNGIYSVYLASPFFNEKEIALVNKLEAHLEDLGFKVNSPSRDGIHVKPGDSRQLWVNAFQWNVEHVMEDDIILAVVDDRDTGTAFEMGAGYIAGTPVVTYTDEDYGVNLMIAECTVAHAKGLEQMKVMMATLRQQLMNAYEDSMLKDVNLEKKRLVSLEATESTREELIGLGLLDVEDTSHLDEATE